MDQVIKSCVAVEGTDSENPKGIKCNAPCEPGFKYCPDHANKKGAVEERQRNALTVLNGGQDSQPPKIQFDEPESDFEEAKNKEVQNIQPRGQMATRSVGSVVDQVGQMLERVYSFTTDAHKAYVAIELEDWSFTDKAGTAQLRPEVSVYERALDRETRVIPQIAKLGMDQQKAIIEKAQFEGIKAAMTRTFIRMGMTQKQIDQANLIIAEEFSRMTA